MRLVIFDFCDTLVNFQTADDFCKYVLKKETRHGLLKIDKFFEKYYFYRLFGKLGLSFFSQKKLLLRGLKGMCKSKIKFYGELYVEDVIEKQLNLDVFKRFSEHQVNGDILIINSGGYEAYLQHFSIKYNIRISFATRFKYTDDIFTGEVEGNYCLGFEKVRRMKETDVLDKIYEDIFVYSDSITDMPIFDLASKKIAVTKQKITPNWCQSNFEIIKI